ncbi:hypothetical protein F5880DRAFT_1577817 [Lentinula raphanica]|nr:hypothetical protein F5880DRAFT_1577817 [Lentinula raphanica]
MYGDSAIRLWKTLVAVKVNGPVVAVVVSATTLSTSPRFLCPAALAPTAARARKTTWKDSFISENQLGMEMETMCSYAQHCHQAQ